LACLPRVGAGSDTPFNNAVWVTSTPGKFHSVKLNSNGQILLVAIPAPGGRRQLELDISINRAASRGALNSSSTFKWLNCGRDSTIKDVFYRGIINALVVPRIPFDAPFDQRWSRNCFRYHILIREFISGRSLTSWAGARRYSPIRPYSYQGGVYRLNGA